MPKVVEIAGGGPSGIAASLAVVRVGARAVVYEQGADVGGRFHGDFQGLENWTSETDVLEELSELGIETSFEHVPIREAVFFGPDGREHVYRSAQPVFYLVRRGADPGALDVALKEQALSRGVDLRFGQRRDHFSNGGVVAHGPCQQPNVIAVGYVFDTDSADGTFAALSEDLASKGYAYLLIQGGRGTVASCIFDHFDQGNVFLERTVEFFRTRVGFEMKRARRFGGLGNYGWVDTARRENLLLVGEAAGFQDALWGFGLRYAIWSGYLAGMALARGKPEAYDRLWKQRMGGFLRASVVNRYLYELMGSIGYRKLLRELDKREVRDWLRRYYGPRTWKTLLAPFARRAVRLQEWHPRSGYRGES